MSETPGELSSRDGLTGVSVKDVQVGRDLKIAQTINVTIPIGGFILTLIFAGSVAAAVAVLITLLLLSFLGYLKLANTQVGKPTPRTIYATLAFIISADLLLALTAAGTTLTIIDSEVARYSIGGAHEQSTEGRVSVDARPPSPPTAARTKEEDTPLHSTPSIGPVEHVSTIQIRLSREQIEFGMTGESDVFWGRDQFKCGHIDITGLLGGAYVCQAKFPPGFYTLGPDLAQ